MSYRINTGSRKGTGPRKPRHRGIGGYVGSSVIDVAAAALRELQGCNLILPEQWNAERPYDPARQLLVTLLVDAALDVRRRRSWRISAVENWVEGRGRVRLPFALVCSHLGIEVEYARKGFRQLIAHQRRQGLIYGKKQKKYEGLRHHQANGGGRKRGAA